MAKRKLSPELAAMARIEAALEGLDEMAQGRVLDWARSKFVYHRNGPLMSTKLPSKQTLVPRLHRARRAAGAGVWRA